MIHVFRIIAAGIFFYAGLVKVIDPPGFLSQIETYHLFPYQFAVVTAYFIPVLEIVAAVGLFIPDSRAERGPS